MELLGLGCRIMDHEAAKSFGNLAMENARNLGTFDYFPKSQTGSPWRRACRNANPYSMSDFNALMGFG